MVTGEIGETVLTIGAATGIDEYPVYPVVTGETALTIGAAYAADEYPVVAYPAECPYEIAGAAYETGATTLLTAGTEYAG